jgi:predicted  nucleic acid-binding Zn-ribbon protein
VPNALQPMQFQSRIGNAQEQAHELTELYGQLERRIASFIEVQQNLTALRGQMGELQNELQAVRTEVEQLQNALPGIARKEEVEQLGKRLDAMPFEKFATKRDL